ncbi:MAG: magnesium transporter [Flavobacteriaceae bacterium]|jgi:magnesium transporter|nr:magnesium transporter [Flavobacteriaceae bacterium]
MTPFQLSEELLQQVKRDIAAQDNAALQNLLKEYHYADLAEIFDNLLIEEAVYLFKRIDTEKTADMLTELDEDVREDILEALSSVEIATEINELDTDDAADIVGELSEELQKEVIEQISDSEHAEDIRELLTYDENSAGGLMAKELVSVNHNWTVTHCVREMRVQAQEVTRVHSIYVVNDNNVLLGRLSLKDLLTANEKSKIKNVFIPKVDYVKVDEDGEEVAKIMSKYDLEALPVVDENKKLMGRITIDDIVDLIKDEAEKDYQLAAGISSVVEADDSIIELTKARLPWLILGLIGGLGSVFILEGFESFMNHPSYRSLFFFTPLIAAMAGNVGVQSSAIIVQGLANDVVKGSLLHRLLKEVGLGLINGGALALLVILFGMITNQPTEVSMTIAISMLCVIIVAALVGTFVPIILNKNNIDPAIATGPFITTSNDIFGIFLFFYIAKLFLG